MSQTRHRRDGRTPSSARHAAAESLEASPRGGFGRAGLHGHYGRFSSNSFMYKHRFRPTRSSHYINYAPTRPRSTSPSKPMGKWAELSPVRVPQVRTAPVPMWSFVQM